MEQEGQQVETDEGDIDRLAAICRWLSLAPYFRRSISLSFRIDMGAVGMVILISPKDERITVKHTYNATEKTTLPPNNIKSITE